MWSIFVCLPTSQTVITDAKRNRLKYLSQSYKGLNRVAARLRGFRRRWSTTNLPFLRDFHPPATKYFFPREPASSRPVRLFILNLPRQGGNDGTSLPCNFLFPHSLFPFSFFFPSSSYVLVARLPYTLRASSAAPSVRHSPLFTTSKRRRRFFPLRCAGKILSLFCCPSCESVAVADFFYS